MPLNDRRRTDRRTGRHRAAPAAAAGTPAWPAGLRSRRAVRGLVLVPAAAAALGLAVLVLDGPGGTPSPQVPPVETVRDQAASVPSPGGVGPHGAPGIATGDTRTTPATTGPTTGPTADPTGDPGSVAPAAEVPPPASATTAPSPTSATSTVPTAGPSVPPAEPDPAEPSPTDQLKPGKGIRPPQAPIPTKPPKP